MSLDSIGLKVFRVGRTFIPLRPKPFQIREDFVERLLGRALAIGIVDAQYELALVVPRVKVREQARANVADVQRAGGARGKTRANSHRHSHSIVAGGFDVMS